MEKNSFKVTTKQIRDAAIEQKRLSKDKKNQKAFQIIIDRMDSFDKTNDGSTEALSDILERQAKAAYERACEAQKALKDLVDRARIDGGNIIIDRAFGDSDKKGGFIPLTPEQYDNISTILSESPPDFKDVYYGYDDNKPLSSSRLIETASTDEKIHDIIGKLFKGKKNEQIKKNLIELGPSFIGANPDRQASSFMHEYIGHILYRAKDNEETAKELRKGGRIYIPYYNPDIDSLDDFNRFFNKEGEIKRKNTGTAWAYAADEALKLSESNNVKPDGKKMPQSTAVWDARIVWRYNEQESPVRITRIQIGAGKSANDKIVVTALPYAGSQSLSVQIWGDDEIRSAAEINCVLTCEKTAILGKDFSAQIEITCKFKEIWEPQKLHDHLASFESGRIAVPPDIYCTPNIGWKGLLIGLRSVPTVEILENLLSMAQELEEYRKHLFDRNPVLVVNGWRALAEVTPKTSVEEKLRAQGLAVDFKVKGIAAPDVQDILMPYHGGGLGIPRGQTYIDLRPYVARLDRDMRIDLAYPPDCRVIPTLTDKDIENAFGKVLKTRRLPKAALPPGCACATENGDVSKGELLKCIRVKDCSCLRELPDAPTSDLKLLEESATIEVNEDQSRTVTKSFSTQIYATIVLIQDVYGEGATNFKDYAFYGGFISRAKVSGIDLVRNLGEGGFCATWLVRIPVEVELKGDFEIVSLPDAEFNGDVVTQNRVVLKAIGHNGPYIEKISFGGIPEAMGPASGTFSYNTAPDGEAHGEPCTVPYAFAGVDITYAGLTDPNTFAGLGSLVVSYNFRFGVSRTVVAAVSFSLHFIGG